MLPDASMQKNLTLISPANLRHVQVQSCNAGTSLTGLLCAASPQCTKRGELLSSYCSISLISRSSRMQGPIG